MKIDPTSPYVPLNEGDVALAEGKKLDDAIDFYIESLSLFKAKGGVDAGVYLRLAGPVAFDERASVMISPPLLLLATLATEGHRGIGQI